MKISGQKYLKWAAPKIVFLFILTQPFMVRAEERGGLLKKQSTSQLQKKVVELNSALEALPAFIPSEQTHGQIGFYGCTSKPAWILIDLGKTVVPEEVVLFPARLPVGAVSEDQGGFPMELKLEIANDKTMSKAVCLGTWQEKGENSSASIPMLRFPGNGASGRFLRVSVLGSRPHPTSQGRFFTLGELVVLQNGRNAALHRPVSTSASIENEPRWQAANLTDGYLWCLPMRGAEPGRLNGYRSTIEADGEGHRKWVGVDLGEEKEFDAVNLVPAHPRDFADTVGFGFPPRFRIIAVSQEGRETVLFDSGSEPFPNPGAATVMIPVRGSKGRRVRLECDTLWKRADDYLLALAELQVLSAGENLAVGKAVVAKDSTESGIWASRALTDGFSSRGDLLTWSVWLEGLTKRMTFAEQVGAITLFLEERSRRNHRWWLIGSMAASIGLGLTLSLVILLQRRHSEASRQRLKNRIARDLHDELGASLSHLALQCDLAKSQLPEDDPVRQRLVTLSETARGTFDNMRDVIWLLSPATGSWNDFISRLESISDRLLEGVDHRFQTDGETPSGAPPIEWVRELVLFYKEALTNACRHASPTRVYVNLDWHADRLHLSIADDGCGFNPDVVELGRQGLGLRNYQRRASELHATCKVKSEIGEGTTVQLDAPFPLTRR